MEVSPHLRAALRVNLIKHKLLPASLLDDHHLLVVGLLHAGAGGVGLPAATEHTDVPLQLQQLVVQTLPLYRLLPVQRSQLLHLPGRLLLQQGQLPRGALQLLQLILHVGQRLLNGGSKLLVGDIQLSGQTAHLAELARFHCGLCDGFDRRDGGSLAVQEGSDLLSCLLLVGLKLSQLLVQVLDDIAQVTYLPGQVAVPLEETVHLLLFSPELQPQVLDDPVPLQEGSAGSKQELSLFILTLDSALRQTACC